MEIKQTGLVVLAAVSIALNIALGYVNGVGSGAYLSNWQFCSVAFNRVNKAKLSCKT